MVRDAVGYDRDQLATKADLEQLRIATKADLANAVNRMLIARIAVGGLIVALVKLLRPCPGEAVRPGHPPGEPPRSRPAPPAGRRRRTSSSDPRRNPRGEKDVPDERTRRPDSAWERGFALTWNLESSRIPGMKRLTGIDRRSALWFAAALLPALLLFLPVFQYSLTTPFSLIDDYPGLGIHRVLRRSAGIPLPPAESFSIFGLGDTGTDPFGTWTRHSPGNSSARRRGCTT